MGESIGETLPMNLPHPVFSPFAHQTHASAWEFGIPLDAIDAYARLAERRINDFLNRPRRLNHKSALTQCFLNLHFGRLLASDPKAGARS